jgi:hypothetical protein
MQNPGSDAGVLFWTNSRFVIPGRASGGGLPAVVMDSLMCNCTSKLDASHRPGMTKDGS